MPLQNFRFCLRRPWKHFKSLRNHWGFHVYNSYCNLSVMYENQNSAADWSNLWNKELNRLQMPWDLQREGMLKLQLKFAHCSNLRVKQRRWIQTRFMSGEVYSNNSSMSSHLHTNAPVFSSYFLNNLNNKNINRAFSWIM